MSDDQPVTLEAIRQIVRDEINLRLLKTEKEIRELKSDVRRHDNRFSAIDGQLSALDRRMSVADDMAKAILERLNGVEEALDIEAEAAGGTLGERLARCEQQIAAINEKLKAG